MREMNPELLPKIHDESICWLCDRVFKSTKRCSKCENEALPLCEEKSVKGHCLLSVKLR